MKIILTNDDGFDAPGLEALAGAVEGLGERIVVAPAAAMSGCGHQVTTHAPIRLGRGTAAGLADMHIIHGTPADCVRVALHRLAPQADWVIAGINAGGNLGADVYHSGTVAAAREAVLHGRPGIAVSHYKRKGMDFDWRQAAAWVRPLLADLLSRPPAPGVLWNINLPHLEPGSPAPMAVTCLLDPAPLPVSFRAEGDALHYSGVYHDRRRRAGSDVDVCFSGRVSVTELRLE